MSAIKQMLVRLPVALIRRAKAEAARRGITLAKLVELALTAFLNGSHK